MAAILLILWALAFAGSYFMGGLIHLLLLVALGMVLFNFFSRRKRI